MVITVFDLLDKISKKNYPRYSLCSKIPIEKSEIKIINSDLYVYFTGTLNHRSYLYTFLTLTINFLNKIDVITVVEMKYCFIVCLTHAV